MFLSIVCSVILLSVVRSSFVHGAQRFIKESFVHWAQRFIKESFVHGAQRFIQESFVHGAQRFIKELLFLCTRSTALYKGVINTLYTGQSAL